MADEVVYRLIAGEGITLTEESGTRTVTVSVPGLSQKINVGDIGQASTAAMGLIEIANDVEVQALADTQRAVTPAGLAAAAQSSATDATPGRLLKVGAFGIGAGASSVPDLNSVPLVGAKFGYIPGTIGAPLPNTYGLVDQTVMGGLPAQVAYDASTARTFFRFLVVEWGAWREFYHSGNFDPATKANTSGTYLGLSVGGAATLNGQTDTQLAPPGERGEFYTQTAPIGWLKANGAAISRTTYARLFAAIGTFFGAGNGSTTFNVPDDRGIFSRGWDDGAGIDTGRVFGSYQADQIISHTHAGVPLNVGDNDRGAGNSSNFSLDSDGITAAFGGTETRPKNRAVLVCIKY